MRATGGTPIEEAPVWVLAILVVVLWIVVFPALVGLANGLRLAAGGGPGLAVAALALTVLLVVGLARQRRWRRPAAAELSDSRPPFVRFATWLVTMLVVPNFLYGAIILFRGGEGLDYASAWAIGLIVSAIQGGFGLVDRMRRRWGSSTKA